MDNLTKRRWVVLIASCIINLCIGSLYAWSVFSKPMAEYLSAQTGGPVENLAYIFTIANAVGPITMISGGFLNKKFGVQKIIMVGGILFGLGMIGSGFAKTSGMLAITYGLGIGFACGLVYGCTVSNSVRFFPDKKGLIGGLAAASYGISSVIVPIIANALINRFGITSSFKILGVAMLILIVGSSFFVISCPDGFVPEGWAPSETGQSAVVNKNYKEMLRDPLFYVMLLMMLCGAFSGMMIISQASGISQNLIGMSAASAAVVVSILALLNTFGRIVSGYMADRLGYPNTLLIAFLVTIVGLGLLVISKEGTTGIFRIGICCVGFGFGSLMGMYPGFTSAQFGPKYHGVNFGIMFIGFALAGYLGPIIMSKIYANSGTYTLAFIVAIGLSVLGIVLDFVFRKMKSNQN